jgi:hypothetical protein
MKNILILLAFVSFANVYAGEKNPASASAMDVVRTGDMVKVFYKGVKDCTVKVTIFNAKGAAVFTETLKHISNFMRPYNFSTLAQGNYTIEISDESGKLVKRVNYVHAAPAVKLASLRKISPDQYILSVASKDAGTITIKIFDSEEKLIYRENEHIGKEFAKIYNIARASGKLTFQVTDENGIVSEIRN